MSDAGRVRSHRYLPVPSGSCLGEVNRLAWVSTTVIRVGAYHVGIRAASSDIREALETHLAPHVVEDEGAPASFGIYAPEPTLDNARPLYRIYHDCHYIFTTRSLGRAVEYLAHLLERHLPRKVGDDGLLELDAAGLIGPTGAVVLPWYLPYKVPEAELLAQRQGGRLLEGFSVLIDPDRREVIAPRSRLIAVPALDVGVTATSPHAEPSGVGYPVTAWIFFGDTGEGPGISRARAIARGMRMVYGRGSGRDELAKLAAVVRQLEVESASSFRGILEAGLRHSA